MSNIYIPKSWDDITVEQYIELTELEYNQDLNFNEKVFESIAILNNTSIDDELFDDLTTDDLLSFFNSIKWLSKKPSYNTVSVLNNKKLLPLNDLTLDAYIDLEYYFSQDYVVNLPVICSILYRQFKQDEWGNEILEPYSYKPDSRSDYYLELPITKVFGIIDYYLKFKESFTENYGILFEEPYFDKIENKEALDSEELKELEKEILEDKKKATWNWELLVYKLCNEDITRADKLFSTNIIFIFNTLAMKKVLNI